MTVPAILKGLIIMKIIVDADACPFLRDNSVRRRIKAYRTFASLDRAPMWGLQRENSGAGGSCDRRYVPDHAGRIGEAEANTTFH